MPHTTRCGVVAATLVALCASMWGCGTGPPSGDSAELTGTAACLACHQDRASYLGTAHHLTSAMGNATSIQGALDGGEAVLQTSNPYLHYRIDSTSTGIYQTAVSGIPPRTSSRSERIDLVIGSGRKGQSYLTWRDGDRLFQLPVSYWTELGRWVNSPGYRDGVANFDRPIPPRCLECHASSFESVADTRVVNRYDPETFTLGIGCARCHGPGQEHIERKRSPIRRFFGQAIVNPAKLPRERQIDLCAQCHGGVGELVTEAFSYLPGAPLEDHLRLQEPVPGTEIDVHGNQVALLARSACFQGSSMTCSTCHDPHLTQRDPSALSAKCLSCHQVQQCGVFPEQGHAIADRCTTCHMPELQSQTIVSSFEGQTVRPRVRSHWIKVYAPRANY